MAAGEAELRRRWPTFPLLQDDLRRRRVVLGVDRRYARRWVILGGEGTTMIGRASGILLLLLTMLSLAGAVLVASRREYLLVVLVLIIAFLSWRLLLGLAVTYARQAALADEGLFLRWFRERRISLWIKDTGEYVWNDAPTAET